MTKRSKKLLDVRKQPPSSVTSLLGKRVVTVNTEGPEEQVSRDAEIQQFRGELEKLRAAALDSAKASGTAQNNSNPSSNDNLPVHRIPRPKGQVLLPGRIAKDLVAGKLFYKSCVDINFSLFCILHVLQPLIPPKSEDRTYITVNYYSQAAYLDRHFLQKQVAEFTPPFEFISYADLEELLAPQLQDTHSKLQDIVKSYAADDKLWIYTEADIAAVIDPSTAATLISAAWPLSPDTLKAIDEGRCYFLLSQAEAIKAEMTAPCKKRITVKSETQRIFEEKVLPYVKNGKLSDITLDECVARIYEIGKNEEIWQQVYKDGTNDEHKTKRTIKRNLSAAGFADQVYPSSL